MNSFEAQPPADQPNVAPEQLSGAALLTTPAEPAPAAGPTYTAAPELLLELPALPVVKSDDGRVLITDTTVTVQGREFLLRELERADVAHVRWILWFLLGGLGLAFVMITYLQNGLRTGPAMLGMALTGLLLAYGHRGTNRLRLHRLGREVVNFALPGETPPWQRLTAELNRRIFRVHDHAARLAAAELAAADETMRLAAQQAAEAALYNQVAQSGPAPEINP
ncbi:hypothetical protein GCM10022409_03290 [Hymenobacter glaciei]|uniref:SMODS and SLOG-associating 2TM effector domain-containing protein n=1 Tax=Hymenobacter glaciei TaxID=877209 RepID=A0ABP7T934_9BACT